MTTHNALTVMRGFRPGQATAWLERIEGEDTLVFGVREESRKIIALGSPVETELRAGAERVGDVLVVPAVLRLGPMHPRGENLFEIWLNAHATDLPSVSVLGKQSRLVTRLFGDGAKLVRTIACPNSSQKFFADAAAKVASMPSWSMDDFDRSRSSIEAMYPSVLAMWNGLASAD